MLKIFVCMILLTLTSTVSAHYMWLETEPSGVKGKPQQVKIFYGEYSYNYYEKTADGFKDVSNFELWLISPDNKKSKLSYTPSEEYYLAEFTPDADGLYYLVMTSENIDVVDWREWDLGILKLGFYASTSVVVGNSASRAQLPAIISSAGKFIITNSPGIPAKNIPTKLNVYYNNKLLNEHELSAGFIEGWTKKIYTDSTGTAEFSAPWDGLYIIEAVYTDKTSGSFNGKEYEAIRSVATYSLRLKN